MVAENFIVALPSLAPSTARTIDVLYWCVFTGVWCVLHLFILLGARFGWFYKKWERVMGEDDDGSQWINGEWA